MYSLSLSKQHQKISAGYFYYGLRYFGRRNLTFLPFLVLFPGYHGNRLPFQYIFFCYSSFYIFIVYFPKNILCIYFHNEN